MKNHAHECGGYPCVCSYTPRYTDHRDELIDAQRQLIDGNTCDINGRPLKDKINELSLLVREERATQHTPQEGHREAPLPYTHGFD